MRKLAIAVAIAASTLAFAHEAAAQAYPSRPIRVFVSSTAGGPLDVFTRLVTHKMEERLKQPFIVENRGGAGGNLAVIATLQAPADGYTILFAIDTTFTVNPALFNQIPFDQEKDLIPVSVMAKFGQVLGVPPSLPVNSIKELKELSLKRELNYGSAGNALPSHLSFAYLQAVTGIHATHIPYRGNPPTLMALINGDVHSVMVISTSLLPFAKQGKVKILAYSDSTRSDVVPDVPTVAEQGYKDFEVVFSYVLMVPTGTPQPVVETLRTEVTRALASPDIRDRLKSVDTVPISLSTAASREWLRTNRKKWTDVITKMNIRPN